MNNEIVLIADSRILRIPIHENGEPLIDLRTQSEIQLEGIPNIPPHSTGAAVDVYLVDHLGKLLEMGILAKDWVEDMVR